MNIRAKIKKKLFSKRTYEIKDQILPFLISGETILDLGAGTCIFTALLQESGHSVIPVDIKNRSQYLDIHPIVYDGKHLPFKNNEFDVCILISVFHHTPHPEVVLKEAARVSKKLVIYEDVITNMFQRFYTYVIDSVLNKDLMAPHTNKTDEEWKVLFRQLGLRLVKTKYRKSWWILENPMYFLKKS